MPAGSQHCGMIPTQSEIPLLLENVSLVFFDRCRLLFVWLVCPSTGPRVLGITVVLCSEIATLWLDSHSVWDSLLLEHVLLVWWFFATHVLFEEFVFLPVVFVLQRYARSRSLVGQRWCLTWCLVIFVLLQCYMRSYACWIATLWHHTHSVWFSFHFWAHLILSLKLCRFSFISQFVFSCLRVLGIAVVSLFEILGWSSLMFEMIFGNFRLTAVWHALICLLDRKTVKWYLRSRDSSAFRECFISFFWIVVASCLFGLFVLQPVPVFLVLQWYFIPRSRHCGLIATQSEILCF